MALVYEHIQPENAGRLSEMSLGVAENLSRLIVDAAAESIANIRLLDGWKGSESDDDFQGTRNWAALLVLLSVPAFLVIVVTFLIWLF
ncbi:hypothetical protein ACQKKX_09240 [Neorhizobium sp. NPDC001467]|uniref:hypothetical protein n=1 Tax=Neorhizobium sp. NPDC001467 TaxID=3390595 RepID=UPI003D05AAC8